MDRRRSNPGVNYYRPYFQKQVFPYPIQDEQIRDFEPHSENFEMELKKFHCQGRRGSGRSTMLARVMVETAIETGQTIEVATHTLENIFGSNEQRHQMGLCRDYVEKLRKIGCDIEIVKIGCDKMQLYLAKYSVDLYNSVKIENNPTKLTQSPFDRVALEKQIEFLKRKKILLLLL
jgi:hypothetical protein